MERSNDEAGDPHRDPVAARTSREGAVATLLAAGAIALLCRAALLAFGRETVLDGFYLHGAWRLSFGDVPYRDFVHVAFPIVEAIYAAVFRLGFELLAIASATTGLAVIATALLLADLVRSGHGRAAGILAAALYATSAHLAAYHAFEREVWTNLGLAWCARLVLADRAAGERRYAMLGVAIAFTLACKLTAAIGVIALLGFLARREGARAALLPLVLSAGLAAGATAICFAAFGAEFTTQVFAFFFWKGESASAAVRFLELLRSAEPAFALGVLGALLPLARGPVVAALRVLLVAWLGYYLALSPSFWDHNAIDLLLPAAGLASAFLVDCVARRARLGLLLAVIVALAATHVLEPRESRWIGFPHGFGADVSRAIAREREAIEANSAPREWIVAPNPLTAAIAGRRPFVSDFELEPVVRGLLREFRFRGVGEALARRGTAIVLGAPEARPLERQSGTDSLFADRVNANTLVHVMPRVLDAIACREIALFLAGTLPPNVESAIRGAGYVPLEHPGVPGYVRR